MDHWCVRASSREGLHAAWRHSVSATRPEDLMTKEIYYSYDTKTGEVRYKSEKRVKLHRNPTDQRPHMYNNGYYASAAMIFNKERRLLFMV